MTTSCPKSVADQYRWPQRFLRSAVASWGKKYVLDSLSVMSWKMSTTFSGMGCFESAALSVRDHAQDLLHKNGRGESASVDLRSALDFDCKDIVFFENTPGYEAEDFFWSKADGSPDVCARDKKTIRDYRRCFGENKKVFDLSQRSPTYFRTELADGCMMVLKTNTKLYSDHDKQHRTMSAEEICACLALPCNKTFARVAKGPLFAVDAVPYNAIVHLAGLGRCKISPGTAGEACPSCASELAMPLAERSFDVDADEHPCQLVFKYMAHDQEHFEILLNNMNAWFVARGISTPEGLLLDNFTFPSDDGAYSLPLLSFWMAKPTEGFPPLVQFRRWCESIWFSFEKAREPLEVHAVTVAGGDMLQQGAVGLTKGYTRSAVILYAIIRTLMIEDTEAMAEPEREFFTQWMLDVLLIPVSFVSRSQHEHSFRSLQLAHQASLREKKNLLQTALRFQERAEDNPSWTLEVALNSAFDEYNNFGLAQQSQQFKLAEREMYGIKALLSGVSGDVQKLMARHLQVNTWQNSGAGNIRNSRWLIGSSGRGATPYWQAVETVNPGKQLFFMERAIFLFNIRKKQVKNLSTARASPDQWEQMLETSCLIYQLLEDMKAATDAAGVPIFKPDDVRKARTRALEGDYAGEFQNLILAKVDFLASDLTFWQDYGDCRMLLQDHMSKEPASSSVFGSPTCDTRVSDAITTLDMESVQKSYEADLLFVANSYVEEHMNIMEADHLDAVAEEVRRVCSAYPKKSAGVIIAPTMISSKVVAGKRGELRRVEDKLDTRNLTSVRFGIRMEQGHGNRRLPLIFPAYVAVNDSATSNIFSTSKLLLNECTRSEISWLPTREYKVPHAKNTTPATTEATERILTYSCGPAVETQFAQRLLAQKLAEDWKSGAQLLGVSAAPYNPVLEEFTESVAVPELLLCELGSDATGAKKLVLSGTVRAKWQDDPIRKDGWADELSKFDARFGTPSTSASPTTAAPTTVPSPASQAEPAAAGRAERAPGPVSGAWAAEPRTVADLEEMYDMVLCIPGRIPTTQLRVVNASVKGKPLSEASDIVPEQEHKLFIASSSIFF
ncbi:unnamed protein product [Symbiodinium sp. CCMP2592]|nr:unnamed protein product [Symbiodinium sp. CCMP2592]